VIGEVIPFPSPAGVVTAREADLLREADREARRTAQRHFERPLVVQAGAGTGKTTTLIARLLAWCLGIGWDKALVRQEERAVAAGRRREVASERTAAAVLGGVVAITFTEAAAAEMAGRAARELATLARGEVPAWLDESVLPPVDELARRARALLGTLDHLAVRTIHSFCRGLLSEHPLEAGLHPELTVDADGRMLEEIVRETVEASLRQGYGDPGDPDLLALASRGFGPREIVEALVALAGRGMPSSVLDRDPFGPEALQGFRDRLVEVARGVHRLIAPRLGASVVRAPNARKIEKGLAELIIRLEEEAAGGVDARTLAAWVEETIPENLLNHLKKWGKELESQAEQEVLGEVHDELCALSGSLCRLVDHLARLDPELLDYARRALRPLLGKVERGLTGRGVATFDALLTGAEALLARNPDVRARVRRGIDQLLVDEFQDTDRVQCELLRWLALDGPRDQRPGLFLVGDPKQSIYGWRSADLRAYDGFVALVRRDGGDVVSLVENFRSVPAILDEVARVVEPVMHERPGLQPPFEPLIPCDRRSDDPGFIRDGWAPVEHWVSWEKGEEGPGPQSPQGKTSATVATGLEAVALAADVRALHDREGVRWSEIAVLLRSTSDLDTYLEALRRARVPFLVGRDKNYYRRREVIEAAALVRAVLDPGDHLALLTMLRSPLAGVPDAALIPLWSRRFPKRMTDLTGQSPERLTELRALIEEAAREVPRDVPGIDRVQGWERSLLAAVEALAALRESFACDPADVFVERMRRLTLVEATEAARYLGPYRLANLDRFFRQLLSAIEDGGGDVSAILRALRKSVAEAREAEEGRPQDGSEDAVHVLTIHGAKGLDFRHVYLMQLHKTSMGENGGSKTEVSRIDLPFGGGTVYEYRLFGAPTLGYDRVEAERREVEAAERVRTLYVAMTRAKDRLVMAGVWPDDPAPRTPEQARTHLDLLLSRPDGPVDLPVLWEEGIGLSRWAFPDPSGALWKFPALRPEDEAAVFGETAGPALATPAEVARDSALLDVRRAEAEERMARPFSGAASEEAHERLREQMAESRLGDREERKRRSAVPEDREAAMAAGGAIHRALETWDLAAEVRAEAKRQRALLPGYLELLVQGPDFDRALPLAQALLDRFIGGPLLDRLRRLRDHVLARELPVLLPPGDREGGPVGFISGAVDLLYKDPETGRLVIADYKTDEVETDEEIESRAAAYTPQGAVYVRALQEALGLPEPPRFELWFLRAGRVEPVTTDARSRTR
jgi:ATP-dependent helicase/nuclease subunit A